MYAHGRFHADVGLRVHVHSCVCVCVCVCVCERAGTSANKLLMSNSCLRVRVHIYIRAHLMGVESVWDHCCHHRSFPVPPVKVWA